VAAEGAYDLVVPASRLKLSGHGVPV
jgi:hypothetical protein